jgi:uncharacterized membrane protein YgcG
MAVMIDIPGVGSVEAKNAASEQTLKDLLKIMKKWDRKMNQGGGGSGGGGMGGGGGSGGGNNPYDPKGAVSKSMHQFGASLRTVTTATIQLANGITGTMNRLANMGDSVSDAARMFEKIPIVGTVFAAVAAAVEKTTAAYQSAAQSGATFGGSVNNFAAAASAAGMTMTDFGRLIQQNGEALRLLGGNTESGGKRFADISKSLRSTSRDLYNMGYTTEDVNKGLANYTKLVMHSGRGQNMTNAQLVEGSRKYLKEIDLLAKITGEERSVKEKQMQDLVADAQYQAAMSGMDEKVAESFRNTVTGLPGPLQAVAKDIMATGSATTEESQKFMSMMPQSAEMMRQFAEKTQRGEQISMAERNKLNEMLRVEGKQAQLQYRDIGRYSSEFATQTKLFTAASSIGENAAINAAAAQDEAARTTDNQAATLVAAQQQLAAIANEFSMYLSSSGILGQMMAAFKAVVDFIRDYVVPAFQNYLVPAVTWLTETLINYVIPTFRWLTDGLLYAAKVVYDFLVPIFTWLGNTIKTTIREYVVPAMLTIRNIIQDYWQPVFLALGSLILYKIIPRFVAMIPPMLAMIPALLTQAATMIGTALAVAVAWFPVIAIVAGVIAVFVGVKYAMDKFGLDLGMVSDGFKWLWTYIKEFGNNLVRIYYEIMDKITVGDEYKEKIAEKEKDIAANTLERENIEKEINDRRKANLAERARIENERKNDRNQAASGNYLTALTGLSLPDFKGPQFGNYRVGGGGGGGFLPPGTSMPGGSNTTTSYQPGAAGFGGGGGDSAVDLGNMSPEQSARYAYNLQNQSAAGADAQRKQIEDKAKAEADAKVKAEEDAKKLQQGKSVSAAPPESAESLLAGLNNKMDQLIKINKMVADTANSQLSVQKGFGRDVFASPST